LEEMLQVVVDLISSAWEYPEITCVRIVLEEQEFRTKNFKETFWKQSSDIIVGGKQIGTLRVCYLKEKPERDEGPFLKEERNLINAIARRLGGMIERKKVEEALRKAHDELEKRIEERTQMLWSLSSKLILTEEGERRRIATGLHDQISQILTVCKMKLGALRKPVSTTGSMRIVEEIAHLIDETIQYTRSLIFQLSPPILYDLGLEAALEWLTEDIQEQYDIPVHFENDECPKPLSREMAILLFRAVRELLFNVAKHAQAQHARILLRRNGDSMGITVEDDGIGFDPTTLSSHIEKMSGFGLFSIRERLDYLGGHLEVESEPGQGTRVTIIAPLKMERTSQEM